MQYKTSRPLKAIKEFIYPPDERRGRRSLFALMAYLGVIMFAAGGFGTAVLRPFLPVIAIMVAATFPLITFVGVRTFYLSRKQYQTNDTIVTSEAAAPDTSNDYRQLDYSPLRIDRPGTQLDPLTTIAWSMAGGGGFLLFILLFAGPDIHPNLIPGLVVIIILLFVPLMWLFKKHGRNMFHPVLPIGYEIFATRNHYIYAEQGTHEFLERIRTLAQFRPYSQLHMYIQKQLTGTYRGSDFALANIQLLDARGRDSYYGVLCVAVSDVFAQNSYRRQFEDQIDALSLVDEVEYTSGHIYCIIADGIPTNRPTMIRLFQVLDRAIDISSSPPKL